MLKQLRENSGLKVNKIAEKLQISRVHYYNYEHGITIPDHEKKLILAELFKVSIEDIEKCFKEV